MQKAPDILYILPSNKPDNCLINFKGGMRELWISYEELRVFKRFVGMRGRKQARQKIKKKL